MPALDEYSFATIPLRFFFNDTELHNATGFVWQLNSKPYLITNWHCVTARNAETGKHQYSHAAEPNKILCMFNARDDLNRKIECRLDIRNPADNSPAWLVHPSHSHSVDVVAIPFDSEPATQLFPINKMSAVNHPLKIGMDVFILGYPFGVGETGLPVWKRGSIASEPQLTPIQSLRLLVDSASRPGMSGSPVIYRVWGAIGGGTGTSFVGVYSGRLYTKDASDAQIGIVWLAVFIDEIIVGGRRDA